MKKANNLFKYLAILLAIIIVSPLDDIFFASFFGTLLFGLGTTAFYLCLIISTAFSIIIWKIKQR